MGRCDEVRWREIEGFEVRKGGGEFLVDMVEGGLEVVGSGVRMRMRVERLNGLGEVVGKEVGG